MVCCIWNQGQNIRLESNTVDDKHLQKLFRWFSYFFFIFRLYLPGAYFCIVSKLYPYYFRRYSISSRITFYEKIRGKFLKPTGFFLSWWFFLGLFLFFYFVSFFMIIFFCFIFSDSSQIEFRKTQEKLFPQVYAHYY